MEGSDDGLQTAPEALFMVKHRIPEVIESLLLHVAGGSHPFPHEAMQQMVLLSMTKSETDIDREIHEVERWITTGKDAACFSPETISSLNFDIFEIPPEGHIYLVFLIFDTLGILEEFDIDRKVFLRWVVVVKNNYHAENPFHNFSHACNVLQTLFVFLSELKLKHSEFITALSPLDVFALAFAALCHDLQHPGVNNDFLVKTLHPLASRYGDKSVLEHHHAAMALATLDFQPLPFGLRLPPADMSVRHETSSAVEWNCDIAGNLPLRHGLIGSLGSKPVTATATINDLVASQAAASLKAKKMEERVKNGLDFFAFRSLVTTLIMATDVQMHKLQIEGLRRLSTAGRDNGTTADADRGSEMIGAQKLVLMCALVEAADISNEIRSFEFSRRWAPRVIEEFCRQGDAMQALHWNGTVAPMFLRGSAHPSKDQPGFIQFLCLPLYRTLNDIWPDVFGKCVAALESNATLWSTKW